MMSTTSPEATPPGLLLPTSTSYPPGTGTPRDAAIDSQQAMSNSQQRANAIGGKSRRKGHRQKRRRRHTRGGASVDSVTVPQFHMQYTPTGGPGSSPNDQITGLSSTSMQQAAWSANDQAATQEGGFKYLPYKRSRRSRRSGSRRSRRSRSRRSQKSRLYG